MLPNLTCAALRQRSSSGAFHSSYSCHHGFHELSAETEAGDLFQVRDFGISRFKTPEHVQLTQLADYVVVFVANENRPVRITLDAFLA